MKALVVDFQSTSAPVSISSGAAASRSVIEYIDGDDTRNDSDIDTESHVDGEYDGTSSNCSCSDSHKADRLANASARATTINIRNTTFDLPIFVATKATPCAVVKPKVMFQIFLQLLRYSHYAIPVAFACMKERTHIVVATLRSVVFWNAMH